MCVCARPRPKCIACKFFLVEQFVIKQHFKVIFTQVFQTSCEGTYYLQALIFKESFFLFPVNKFKSRNLMA